MPDDHASSREPSPNGVGQQEVLARRVRVLLPLPLPEALDYLAPEGTSPPEPGSFVNVPLGQRSLTGVVWDGVGDELPEERLKPIIETLPTPRLQPELRRFECTSPMPANAANVQFNSNGRGGASGHGRAE